MSESLKNYIVSLVIYNKLIGLGTDNGNWDETIDEYKVKLNDQYQGLNESDTKIAYDLLTTVSIKIMADRLFAYV